MLGYDFMLDESLHAYLIEINRSPDMNHTTAVTARLVPLFYKDMTGLFDKAGWSGFEKLKISQ